MKTSSISRNLLTGALVLIGSASLAQAKGNFISMPIDCTAIDNTDSTAEIRVNIKNANGHIIGSLEDHTDRANLKCKIVPADGINLNYLSCNGQWESDGSDASLSTPLFTYTPMTTIQRSSASGAAQIQGICIN